MNAADIRGQLDELLAKVENLARISDGKPSLLGECPICENVFQHKLNGLAINVLRSPTKWRVGILYGLSIVAATCDCCSYCRMFVLFAPEGEPKGKG